MLFLHFRLSEQAEVHAAVCPVFNESGHILKAVVLAVFEYKMPLGFSSPRSSISLGRVGSSGRA